MRIYRLVCNTDSAFVQAILGVTQDDVIFLTDPKQRLIDIPDLEAYRTGLPCLRKAIKPRKCFFRYLWPQPKYMEDQITFDDDTYPAFKDKQELSGTNIGIWRLIDKKHKEGEELHTYINHTSFYGQYKITFGTHISVTFKHSKVPITIPAKDILESSAPNEFYSIYANKENVNKSLKYILKNWIKLC